MSPEQWKRLHDLFEHAAALPTHARSGFLARSCGDDAELLAELKSLLAHHEQAQASFLEPEHPAKPTLSIQSPANAEAPSPGPDHAGAMQNGKQSPNLPADLIAGYEILQELSRGGQGVVYLAFQKGTKRKVAIKVLLEGAYASKNARRRFEREIELVAQLNHPNIVQVFDSGNTKDSQQYCVMDYVRGLPLDKYVQEKKQPLEEALQLFSKVCEAVNYAHQRGVIHRDLKPNNILVDSEGQPKILDFGLAKTLAGPEEAVVSLTGQVLGTLPYMSPEQTRGNPDKIDIRTDVYALGVVLYEILTGQYPYPVMGQLADVLKHIAETPPTPPSRTWKNGLGIAHRSTRRLKLGACPIDDEVQTIVLRSLAKERERRYQSAGDLGKDVEHYLADEPIEAKRDSGWYVLKKLLRRYKIPASLGMAFVLFLIASVVIMSILSERNRRLADSEKSARIHEQQAAAEAETRRKRAERLLYVTHIREADRLISERRFGDASMILTNVPPNQAGWEYWHLKSQCSRQGLKNIASFKAHDTSILTIDLSPDARHMASAAFHGEVKLWDMNSKTATTIQEAVGKRDNGESRVDTALAFSADNARFAFMTSNGHIRIHSTIDLRVSHEFELNKILDAQTSTEDKFHCLSLAVGINKICACVEVTAVRKRQMLFEGALDPRTMPSQQHYTIVASLDPPGAHSMAQVLLDTKAALSRLEFAPYDSLVFGQERDLFAWNPVTGREVLRLPGFREVD